MKSLVSPMPDDLGTDARCHRQGQPATSGRFQTRLTADWRQAVLTFAPDSLPGGSWVRPRFIDTQDNREALRIARDLITHGEPVAGRVGDEQARAALVLGQPFTAPMQTTARVRSRAAAGRCGR